MKYLLCAVFVAILTSCAREAEDPDDIVEEPAEEFYESVSDTVHGTLEEAEEVEDILTERAEATERAIEESVDD